MNLLDERLRHSCISIVLATIKVFLNYAADNFKITESIYKRTKCKNKNCILLIILCFIINKFT